MSVPPVVVIGGGVAGCAAAVAAAEAGADTILFEASRRLGGVAVQGEHRTLCGLAPIDAAAPDLLEPDLTDAWIAALTIEAPFRQGRVWLWPTAAHTMQAGLHRRPERPVHELVLLEQRLTFESARYDASLVVVFGSSQVGHLDLRIGECGTEEPADIVGFDHGRCSPRGTSRPHTGRFSPGSFTGPMRSSPSV